MTDPIAVVGLLRRRRFPLNDEKRLQDLMLEQFASAGFPAEAEVRLNAQDIVDFMIGGVAVEVKIKGARRAIYGQCERYCQHERVTSLVLATNISMGMPEEIHGKPIYIVNLGMAWL